MMRREAMAMTMVGSLTLIAMTAIISCCQIDSRGGNCRSELLNIAFTAVGALGGAMAIRWEEKHKDHGEKP